MKIENFELIDVVKSGDLATIKRKLNPKNIDLRDESGNTLLALAGAYDHLDIIKYFLDKGADMNLVNRFNAGFIDFVKSRGSNRTKKFIDKNYIRIN